MIGNQQSRAMRKYIVPVLFLSLVSTGCSKQKSTRELIQDLKSPNDKDRIIAVRLLETRTGEPAEVVPALIDSLKGTDPDVRISAAIGLGYFGEQANDAIPALQAAQKDRDARVREAAGVALSRIDSSKFSRPVPGKPRGK
jgi:HEAT repeat protein